MQQQEQEEEQDEEQVLVGVCRKARYGGELISEEQMLNLFAGVFFTGRPSTSTWGVQISGDGLRF